MSLGPHVSALMRAVASTAVLPRFRRLAAHEIAEKSPGELVTAADLDAERRLADGLAALCPEARIVGEEAAADDPRLLDGVGQGLVWLIDPLDGTANFANGREPFGMMVALVEDGITLAGWILDPLSGRLCHAEDGGGATVNDMPVTSRTSGRFWPVAALGTHFMSAERRERVHACAERRFDVQPVPRCAAESYARLALGHDDVALFQRTLPWDHAAGALFLSEAGGKVTDWHGNPWRVGTDGIGLLAGATEQAWQAAADLLLTPAAGLLEAEAFAS
jgi:fructose-1,6-bisphosphatase/inositol monophosphatase family enzyme